MFGLSIEQANEWVNRSYLISGPIAIVGTAFALLAAFVLWRYSAKALEHKDRELAHHQENAAAEVSRAQADADLAKADAARARKETGELLERTELLKNQAAEAASVANNATLKLFQAQQPRSLSGNRSAHTTRHLAAFKGAKFDIALSARDRESLDLGENIINALLNAGWIFVPWGKTEPIAVVNETPIGVVDTVGVVVSVCSTITNASVARSGALILQQELNYYNLGARAEHVSDPQLMNDVVHIAVGKRF